MGGWRRVADALPLRSIRTQTKMVGRYYWYSHDCAAAELGYRPRSGRQALAQAIAWLVESPHISPLLRVTLRLAS
jgi:dihydroflavonol-4-reductase